MPNFFPFIPGTETSRTARQHASDASPLLGRFRAVPRSSQHPAGQHHWHARPAGPRRHRSSSASHLAALLSAGNRGSVHIGYGALVTAALQSGNNDDSDEDYYDSDDEPVGWFERAGRTVARNVQDLWVAPQQNAVKRVVESWWRRWGMLIFLPAGLVSSLGFVTEVDTSRGRREKLITKTYRRSFGAPYPSQSILWIQTTRTCTLVSGTITGYLVTERRAYRSTFGSFCLYITAFTTSRPSSGSPRYSTCTV